MPARIITVVNMKGGVGKTTTVIALSETLAANDNANVLVIDLDAQASASYSIAGDQILSELIQNDRTIDAYFEACLVHKQPIPFIDWSNGTQHHHASQRHHVAYFAVGVVGEFASDRARDCLHADRKRLRHECDRRTSHEPAERRHRLR